MKSNHGWEQLHKAVHSLAGEGSQKERLVDAMNAGVFHVNPDEDLPAEIQAEFTFFVSNITSVENSVQATVDTYDDSQVNSAVSKIINFYDAICRHMQP